MHALLLTLLLSAPDPSPARLPRYAFYGGLNAADLVSTEAALARCAGCSEGNPLLQSRSGRVAVKALATVGFAEIDRALSRRRKPKAVWAIRIGALALNGFAAYHNHRVGR